MTDKESLNLHMNLGMLLSNAHRAMTKRFVQNTHKIDLDISLDQWMVLGPIWELNDACHKELAEYCLKDKTSITKIIDNLEKKNLVVRVPDQVDHRKKRVVLTNAGKQLFFDVLPVMEKTRSEVQQDIPDKDIEIFKQVLMRITANLDDEEGCTDN